METDRRMHPRTDLDAVVEYSGTAGVKCTGIKNISISGVRLEISGPEQPGTQVSISISSSRHGEAIALAGQIAWARQAQPYEVGIRFLEQNRKLAALLSTPL